MFLVMKPVIIPRIESILHESQSGARPERSCTDQLFNLRVLVEMSLARRLPLYVAFIDLAKAFDSIERRLLFLLVRSYGLPGQLMTIFESMYNHTQCAVRVGSVLSDCFATCYGVQQGCLSGSWCFNLVIHLRATHRM